MMAFMSVTLMNSASTPALVAAYRATASSFLQLAQPDPRSLTVSMGFLLLESVGFYEPATAR